MSMDQRLTEAAAKVPDIGERLRQAAEAGDNGALYALIREDARVLERIDEEPFFDTPLHIAASAGHIDFAMEIVNLKASFTGKLNPDGFSPMHLALRNEQMLMVMWLIDVDRNLVRLKGKEGITPLHYATQQGNLLILKECLKGCPDSIKDVTFHGDTALHIAVKNHQKDAFELLMEWLRQSEFEDAYFWEGELLNWKNKEGKTVLHIAASGNGWNDRHQVLEMLLRCHARTDIKDLDGLTAMEILKGPGGLTEKEIWNMQAAGAGFSFRLRLLYKRVISPLILLYKSVISPLILLYKSVIASKYSVHQEAQTSRLKSRCLMWKLFRDRKWKSSERSDAELLVDTLILTALYQASLSPPGGLWQGTADINSPIRVGNSSTSEATSPHFTGTSVMSQTYFLTFYYVFAGLFIVTAFRIILKLAQDKSGISFSIFPVYWLVGSYAFSMVVIRPVAVDRNSSFVILFSCYFYIAVFLVTLIMFVCDRLALPSEPRVNSRRARQTILDRKEWW